MQRLGFTVWSVGSDPDPSSVIQIEQLRYDEEDRAVYDEYRPASRGSTGGNSPSQGGFRF